MKKDTAIVNPVKGNHPPDLGRVAVLAATQADFNRLIQMNSAKGVEQKNLYMSRVAVFENQEKRYAVAGPFMGAPYAAMMVEALAVWGVEKIIFLGWCGAVSESVKTGDIILADQAFIDEGTSKGYDPHHKGTSSASSALLDKTASIFDHENAPCTTGPVWSTDAVFRETKEKVMHYREKGALAVEMEISAIYTVAAFRKIQAAAMVVVSDELSTLKWKPGFKTPAFKTGCKTACKMAHTILQALL